MLNFLFSSLLNYPLAFLVTTGRNCNMSGNRGLNVNQNHTCKSITTRVLAPPGGSSSFSLGDMSSGPAHHSSYRQASNRGQGVAARESENSYPHVAKHGRKQMADYEPERVSPGKRGRSDRSLGGDSLDAALSKAKKSCSIPGLENHYAGRDVERDIVPRQPLRSTRNNVYYQDRDSDADNQASSYSNRGDGAPKKMSSREYADALREQIETNSRMKGKEQITGNIGARSNRERRGSDSGYDSGRDERQYRQRNSEALPQQSLKVNNPPGGHSSFQLY